MKTLDLSKIYIIGSELDSEEPITRIYIVAKLDLVENPVKLTT